MPNSGTSTSCVFFGTGPVAAKCLELLLLHTHVEAVVTKPRPPHHKASVPVLELAEARGIPTHTVTSKMDVDKTLAQAQFTSRYGILIDFGIIISRAAIDAFELGIINSHFSLLPHLRGADPITWAIANGDEKTGVSLMLVDKGMDTGKLLTYRTLHIASDDTTPTLTDKLIALSDELIQECVPNYLSGELKAKNQPHPDRATYSRKLTKQDGIIDWSKPASQIEREIRAFIGWPASRTTLGTVDVIITSASVSNSEGLLSKKCGDGKYLLINTLKPLGKKEMPAKAFLAGYKSRL